MDKRLANKIEDNKKQLANTNFIVHGIVIDNHSTNTSAFDNFSNKYIKTTFP